jgi:uncharacterized membrane protein YfcA
VDASQVLALGPSTLLVLAAAIFLAGCLAGTTGVGFAAIASVALALLLDARSAVLLISGITPLVLLMPVLRYRQLAPQARRLRPMFLTMPLGVLLGVWLLVRLPPAAIALGLGVLTVVSVLVAWRRGAAALPARWERLGTPLIGVLAGALNSAMGVSGPVLGVYLLSLRLEPRLFAFSVNAMFVSMSVLRLLLLLGLGELTAASVLFSLALCVPAFVGLRVGFWLEERLDARAFERLLLGVLLVTGCQLVQRGLSGLGLL